MQGSAGGQNEQEAVPQLRPVRFQPRWAWPRSAVFVTLFFGVCFWYWNWLPLYPTDLWGHVLYGQWILEHRSLPAEDPFVPLAQGIPIVDTAWLSQVLFATAERIGGPEWLSHLYALATLATHLTLARVYFLLTRRLGLALLGVVMTLVLAWGRLSFMRPELLAVFSFAIMIWLLTPCLPSRCREERPASGCNWRCCLGVPLVLVVWANLHGSFAVGLVFLAACCVGQSVEAVLRSRTLLAVWRQATVRQLWLTLVVAVLATLINPYGLRLLLYTGSFSANTNLSDLTEWSRLDLLSLPGVPVGISGVLFAVLMARRRTRLTITQVLLMILFGLAVYLRIRFLNWYACVATFAMLPHLGELFRSPQQPAEEAQLQDMEGSASRVSCRYTLLSALLAGVFLAISPLGVRLQSGHGRAPDRLYSQVTPVGISRYLREHPPQGPIFNSQAWGDWLLWDGPPGLAVFVTTNTVHVLDNRVWRDYLRVCGGVPEWRDVLARYQVRTIVLDKYVQRNLLPRLRASGAWELKYDDPQGAVFERSRTASPVSLGLHAASGGR